MDDKHHERIREYARHAAEQAPPLTPDQRDRLAILLSAATPRSSIEYEPPRVPVHYDEEGRCLFVGGANTDLLRHVQLRYSKRVEKVVETDARNLDPVFGALDRPAIKYLVTHDDLGWVMPVQHMNNNAHPLPQIRPWRQY